MMILRMSAILVPNFVYVLHETYGRKYKKIIEGR